MPEIKEQAIEWALKQENVYTIDGVLDNHMLVHYVRQYFNENNIEYSTFSFADLQPFLN